MSAATVLMTTTVGPITLELDTEHAQDGRELLVLRGGRIL